MLILVETKHLKLFHAPRAGAAVYCQGLASSLLQQGGEGHLSTGKGSVPSCNAQWAQERWAEQGWWQEQVVSTTWWPS